MRTLVIVVASCLLCLCSCQNISCPLENTVALRVALYSGDEPVTFGDTLSVTATGTDSVLLNRLYRFSTFELPMRATTEAAACDTLILRWALAAGEIESALPSRLTDTLYVQHAGRIHFETIDCPAAVFHTLSTISSTHTLIDSVAVTSTSVDYETTENLRLYLRPRP